MSSTLVLLKPDIVGHPILLRYVISELLEKGLQISAARRLRLDRSDAENLYGIHRGRFFYPRLVRHVVSGPVVALEVQGDARSVLGSSKLWPLPDQAEQTVRQLLALSDVRNVAHNSDPENADKELSFFKPMRPLLSVGEDTVEELMNIKELSHIKKSIEP